MADRSQMLEPVEIVRATEDEVDLVAEILTEAATWLEASGMAMWKGDELTPSRIASDVLAGQFFLAKHRGEAAGAIRFQLTDEMFWPDMPEGDAAYVHRLAVRRAFSGQGVSTALLAWSVERTRMLGRRFLRLDTVASRAKLRALYENFGFRHHSDRQVGPYLVARYEIDVHGFGAGKSSDAILSEQLLYYRARAAEYDEWFDRQGRYDRGPEHRARWFDEISIVDAALQRAGDRGDVLELACGTGVWTRRLAKRHRHVVAVDASPEVIAVNEARLRSATVDFVVADLFNWSPEPRSADLVFFGFWLSHVPQERFEAFWQLVRRALRPGGCAFFVDSLRDQSSTAVDHPALDDSGIAVRHLNDGRVFRVVKVFHDPQRLQERLAALGWQGWVKSSGTFFLYGTVTPASE